MTRHVVAIEGRPSGDGRLIEVGALVWEHDPIPVTDLEGAGILGKATDFRREDDGSITADVYLMADVDPDRLLTISADQVSPTKDPDGTLRYSHARIRGLFTTTKWPWPE